MVYPLSALMCALYLILSYWIAKYNIFFRRRVDKILSTQLTFSVFNLVKYQILSMLVLGFIQTALVYQQVYWHDIVLFIIGICYPFLYISRENFKHPLKDPPESEANSITYFNAYNSFLSYFIMYNMTFL